MASFNLSKSLWSTTRERNSNFHWAMFFNDGVRIIKHPLPVGTEILLNPFTKRFVPHATAISLAESVCLEYVCSLWLQDFAVPLLLLYRSFLLVPFPLQGVFYGRLLGLSR
jgi:hypothetical protein